MGAGRRKNIGEWGKAPMTGRGKTQGGERGFYILFTLYIRATLHTCLSASLFLPLLAPSGFYISFHLLHSYTNFFPFAILLIFASENIFQTLPPLRNRRRGKEGGEPVS
jgi:hypothetical protein